MCVLCPPSSTSIPPCGVVVVVVVVVGLQARTVPFSLPLTPLRFSALFFFGLARKTTRRERREEKTEESEGEEKRRRKGEKGERERERERDERRGVLFSAALFCLFRPSALPSEGKRGARRNKGNFIVRLFPYHTFQIRLFLENVSDTVFDF